ncbi:MAG: Glycerophosphoryl diester phosphodiesterase precursor [Verrucomicrobiota bacterium]|jgi:glycerophosphoryl diester phosphodiesterase
MKSLLLLTTLTTLTAMAQEKIIIAHRGASGYVPEHTLGAKAMAHAMGAPFIEQDLVLSKDDIPVVLHDIHVDTISDVATRFPERQRKDGRYYALDFTLAELKQLRVCERFNAKTGKQVFPKRFPKGVSSFQIPTLEEELELIQGLNQSTGRVAGIYPEIKQPSWHRKEGHDISRIVLPILHKFGYRTKDDLCYLQCFEHDEVQRLRHELGWQGRLIMLMSGGKTGPGNTDFVHLRTPEGLRELARTTDGVGPDIGSIINIKREVTELVKNAHAQKLQVHAYTLRVDELPKFARSADDLLNLLFHEAGIDGLFTDFPDVGVKWLQSHPR